MGDVLIVIVQKWKNLSYLCNIAVDHVLRFLKLAFQPFTAYIFLTSVEFDMCLSIVCPFILLTSC